MTKLARVISIVFIITIFTFFTSRVFASFDDLLKPIPEETSSLQPADSNQPTSAVNPPSVTFGDLLSINSTPSADLPGVASDDAQIASKSARFMELLANLNQNSQVSLEEFQAKSETLPRDLPYVLNHPTPTPTPSENQLFLASLTNPDVSPIPSPAVTIAPQPTIAVYGNMDENPPKNTYSVALLGDSMTDTLGKSLPVLRSMLELNYPNKFFSLLNYGQGATDLESGLKRLTNTTNYLGTDYPPLLSYKPDILVVESFAYNHWSGEKYDLDRQWLDFAKIVDTVRENSPNTKIIFAAAIAPNKDIFGDGVLNWPQALKENATIVIKAYLQNAINFATSMHYPLADAYHPSLEGDGQGIAGYINNTDHLHPSPDGAYLYSEKILEAIKVNGLIN